MHIIMLDKRIKKKNYFEDEHLYIYNYVIDIT